MNNQIAQMLMGRAPAQRPQANPLGAAVPQQMRAPMPRPGAQPQMGAPRMGGMPNIAGMQNMGAMQPPQPAAQPGQAQPVRGRDGRMYRVVVDPTTGLQTFTPYQGGMA